MPELKDTPERDTTAAERTTRQRAAGPAGSPDRALAARAPSGLILRMRRFLRRDPGNATLEFVIWFPLFIFMLLVVVDMSTFYLNQTRMHNVSRDASRRMSVGKLEATDLTTYVSGQLSGTGYTIVNCSTTESSCVRIERAVNETLVFGSWIGTVLGDNFIVQTTTPFEPEPV